MSTSTAEETTDHSLPSFTTYSSDLDQSWDYYERTERIHSDVISSHNSTNYTRPWEMDPKEKGFEPFPKLPSFQSQFHTYVDPSLAPEPSLPQVTPVPVPISPSIAPPTGNGSLTQLTPINPLQTGLTTLQTPSFHTLTAVNTRTYPLVPAPIQARDIPSINQQYLEERHIQLYQPITAFPPQNTVLTVIKNEPNNFDLKNGLHHSHFQNPLIDNDFETKLIKTETDSSPTTRCDARKKERRKNHRASSLESSTESESSAMEMGDGNSGQVAAVSSTASFKSPMNSMGMNDDREESGEKQVRPSLSYPPLRPLRGIIFFQI